MQSALPRNVFCVHASEEAPQPQKTIPTPRSSQRLRRTENLVAKLFTTFSDVASVFISSFHVALPPAICLACPVHECWNHTPTPHVRPQRRSYFIFPRLEEKIASASACWPLDCQPPDVVFRARRAHRHHACLPSRKQRSHGCHNDTWPPGPCQACPSPRKQRSARSSFAYIPNVQLCSDSTSFAKSTTLTHFNHVGRTPSPTAPRVRQQLCLAFASDIPASPERVSRTITGHAKRPTTVSLICASNGGSQRVFSPCIIRVRHLRQNLCSIGQVLFQFHSLPLPPVTTLLLTS